MKRLWKEPLAPKCLEALHAILADFKPPTQAFPDGAGFTEPNRQQDGNLLLSRIPFFTDLDGTSTRIALFAGGSIGITAAKFLLTLPLSTQTRWKVLNADIFHPREHSSQLKFANPSTGEQQYLTLNGVNYVQADLVALPFAPGSVDFVDACNTIGYVRQINDRLDVAQSLWNILKVGGYLRTTNASEESIFGQVIVRKMGERPADWDLTYINITGRLPAHETGPLEDPHQALSFGLNLTQRVAHLRELIKEKKPQMYRQSENDIPDRKLSRYFLNDLQLFSPITFAAGVHSDIYVYSDNQLDTFSSKLGFLESLLDASESFLTSI